MNDSCHRPETKPRDVFFSLSYHDTQVHEKIAGSVIQAIVNSARERYHVGNDSDGTSRQCRVEPMASGYWPRDSMVHCDWVYRVGVKHGG